MAQDPKAQIDYEQVVGALNALATREPAERAETLDPGPSLERLAAIGAGHRTDLSRDLQLCAWARRQYAEPLWRKFPGYIAVALTALVRGRNLAEQFAVAAFSVNMYTMPLDTFGGARSAFAIQVLVSPVFGAIIDHYEFAPVCRIVALTPLAAYGVLKWTE